MGKLPGMSSVEIQALAVLGALKDAGYRLSELDGVINLNPYQSPACSRRLSQSILASSRASARVRTRKKVDLTAPLSDAPPGRACSSRGGRAPGERFGRARAHSTTDSGEGDYRQPPRGPETNAGGA